MYALIIDDSRAIRTLIGRMVTSFGLEPRYAANGLEALGMLGASEQPTVVLVDWNMPVMNGIDFVRAMRANTANADVRVVMVTSETDPAQMQEALACGANEWVMKPFNGDMLRDKLLQLNVIESLPC
ncbi:response regulator [Gemmatimonas groenlandica]|uniref:Response regulator n=1 Tax=Gemmatimonas groenlandica TaxID=2732249 RepID=A0A6M4IPS1_9BACT|nr:response regulator [Gemmatimonas groenlandica]QJR35958.1 response regulator [Gemmatimonas groenlandica]